MSTLGLVILIAIGLCLQIILPVSGISVIPNVVLVLIIFCSTKMKLSPVLFVAIAAGIVSDRLFMGSIGLRPALYGLAVLAVAYARKMGLDFDNILNALLSVFIATVVFDLVMLVNRAIPKAYEWQLWGGIVLREGAINLVVLLAVIYIRSRLAGRQDYA